MVGNKNNIHQQNKIQKEEIASVFRPMYNASSIILFESFILNIFKITIPLFIFFTIDIFLNTKNTEFLIYGFISCITITLLQYIISRLRSKKINTLEKQIDENIFKHILDKLFSLSNAKIENRPDSFWLSLFDDIDTIKNTLTSSFLTTIIDIIFIAIAIGICIMISKDLFPIIILLFSILGLATFIFYQKIFAFSGKEKISIQTRNTLIMSSIKNISAVKSLPLKEKIKKSWEDYQAHINSKMFQKYSSLDQLKDFSQLLSSFLIITLIYILGINILNGKIEIGTSILIIFLTIAAFDTISKLISYFPEYLKFTYASERLNMILTHNTDKDKNMVITKPLNAVLKTESLYISDKRGKPIINDLDMHLYPGKIYIIKGRLSSSESLFLKAFAGIYKPESGSVLLDNYNVNNISLTSISNFIRYMSDPVIFYGTLKENITCFYNSKIQPHHLLTFNNIISTLSIGNIADNLPHDYNTIIDNNHDNLSPEELQIINLARNLIGNPSLILLDNPFTNLSSEIRNNLIKLLSEVAKDKIVIINSSTYDSDIPNADVLLIKNGSITIEENKFIDRTTSKRSLFRKVKF